MSTLRVLLRADDRGVIAKPAPTPSPPRPASAAAARPTARPTRRRSPSACSTSWARAARSALAAAPSAATRAGCPPAPRARRSGLPGVRAALGAAAGGRRARGERRERRRRRRPLELPPLGAWTHGARVGAALGELLSFILPRCGVADGTATRALALASLAMRAAHALHASGTLVVRPDGADGARRRRRQRGARAVRRCARDRRAAAARVGRAAALARAPREAGGMARQRAPPRWRGADDGGLDRLRPSCRRLPPRRPTKTAPTRGAAPAVIAPVVPLVAVSSTKRGKEKEHLFDGSLTSYWQSDELEPERAAAALGRAHRPARRGFGGARAARRASRSSAKCRAARRRALVVLPGGRPREDMRTASADARNWEVKRERA